MEEKQEVPQEELIERPVDSVEEPAQTDAQAEPETDSGELEVSIEGDSPPPVEQDSSVIREMRKALREKERNEKRLREELEALKNPKQDLGPKPTLDDPAIDYDAEKFAEAILAWNERKRQAESEAAKQEEAQKAEQQVYAERLERYNAEKQAVRIVNFEEAEAAVTENLSVVQQSVLIKYFDSVPKLVAGIGSSHETAKKLAAIKDPIAFALAVKDLEAKVKTTPRKPPPPEGSVNRSSAPASSTQTLARLESEASKTGDFTKLVAYLATQKRT